jgi:competence protein ComGC
MNIFTLIIIILIILLLLIIIALIKYKKRQEVDHCIPKIFQFNSQFNNYEQSDNLNSPLLDIANDFKIIQMNNFKNANLILFTDYSLYDQHFNKIKYKDKCNYKIMAINGIDMLANKKILAEKLVNTGLIPQSYSLDNDISKKKILADHFDNKIYFLKKNIQRQQGNLITKDIDFIINKASSENYVVCQELLQDPFIVNGRKINMRIYLLIVIKNNICDFYIYNDGFIYYTAKHFEKNSTDNDVNITSGFIDRKVYDENPLTIHDMYKHIGYEKSKIIQQNIEKCFSKIYKIYKDDFILLNKNTPGIKFCVYGADIAPDENLNIKIIELNKGPSLESKDERDGLLKYNMIRDAFGIVHILDDSEVNINNFILII